MSDPREVAPRCHQRLEPVDKFMRWTYVCTFHEGHTGMHSGKPMRQESGEIITDGEIIRWGSPGELATEVALMAPIYRASPEQR
jgi:hypothetical protein